MTKKTPNQTPLSQNIPCRIRNRSSDTDGFSCTSPVCTVIVFGLEPLTIDFLSSRLCHQASFTRGVQQTFKTLFSLFHDVSRTGGLQ
ncbi:hypothetical protein AVEN_92989-1 [Araneus ventricosus]|uniref:Uncharacterized protein n=1 Tax=Araneus ventricosus TaxID=182803 RepID=A0A4Y2QP47_ARAVE|nr:hypothetical protein AVEN_92989-1 [Araneus ventricosus]